MSNKALFCITETEEQAEAIVSELQASGFPNEDISVLFPDKTGSKDFAHERHTKAPEGAVAGAGTGGLLGGTLGYLAGIGTLAIPGLGPFVAAGPIMAALSGAAVLSAIGGIAGALVGLGIPEFEAKRFEGKVREGNILISVHAKDGASAERAKDIFQVGGAHDISESKEVSIKE